MWSRLKKKHPWLYEAAEWGMLALSAGAFVLACACILGGNSMMATMTTPADVSDQLMGLYGPEQLREVERLSTYNYRARLAGGEIVLAVVRGDGSLALIEPEMDG